ncbi:MAG: GAF domain-containing protein, partial [Anaerolineales bacterium]|nr:GAF domain-containing protein [Anaerolineales bacterium]
MTLPSSPARLLAIQSDDETIVQKGHLVQRIILALTVVSFLSALINVLRLAGSTAVTPWFAAVGELILTPVLALVSLFVVRRGRPLLAAHLFFITLNTIFFAQFVARQSITALPYLMLISVIGIATVDSVRSSIVYTILIIASMLAYYLLAPNVNFTFTDLVAYLLTTLSISATAWISANAMQKSLQTSIRLMADQQARGQLLQRRALQLQRGAAVSQTASTSLDLQELLRDTVYTIRDQFGFYFVAIYLLDETGGLLTLTEATGAVGEEMKLRRYQVDLAATSIVGWVAQHREARIAHNVLEDPVYFSEPLLRETRAELALPLQAHGRVLGVLDVQSQQPGAFLEDDLAILQIMANQIAASIDNAGLFARTEQHLLETQTLLNLSSNLATTMDVGEIYRRATRTFANQLSAASCTIMQWDEANDLLVAQITYVRSQNGRLVEGYDYANTTYNLSEHPGSAQVLTSGQPRLHHVNDADLTAAESQALARAGHHSCLQVPLMHGPQARGAVRVTRGPQERPFTETDIQLAQVMANETAIALNNATLTSEARGRVAQLSALNRLSQALSLAPTLHDIFDSVRREVFSLFEATAMSVILVTPDGEHLDWIFGYEYGQEIDLSDIAPLSMDQGFSGQVARTRQYLLINDRFRELAEEYQSITVGAMSSTWLGFPLIAANKLIGVLSIENESDNDAFGERDVQLLETIAGTV